MYDIIDMVDRYLPIFTNGYFIDTNIYQSLLDIYRSYLVDIYKWSMAPRGMPLGA